MAIIQEENGAPKGNNTAFAEALGNAQQSQTAHEQPRSGREQSQQAGRRPGVLGLNNTMRRPMARKSTGEVVVQFAAALREAMNRNFAEGAEESFKLIPLDKNVSNVGPMSAILVTYNEQVNGQNFLAVYTLLIEGSAPRLNARPVNIAGRNVEVDPVAGDVYNDTMWNNISDYLTNLYGLKMNIMDAGCMVIPTELSAEDEEHVRRILFNSTQALYTVMDNNLGGREEPFTIGSINTQTDQLIARLDYNPGEAETSTAEPIRSDVRITLQGSVQAQHSQTGFDEVVEIASVDGYVDLVFSAPPPVTAPGQMPITQSYYPRYVITRMDSEVNAITMELQLAALAQTTLLSRNHAWAGVMKPRHHVKGTDTRDIGAIGYEVNLTGDPNAKLDRIDTKAKSFDDVAFYQLITTAIHPDPIYSMDIEEVGELSWIHQAFIAAANGNADAHQLIVESANKLTNGAFQNVYQGGPIAYDDNVRVHLGYYVGEDGQNHDLRDIDYLALLNIVGKEDPSVILKWDETFNNRDIPIEIRMEDRANILKAILPGNVHIKGYARRVTYNPDFIEALNIACAQAGLVVRPNNLIQTFTGGQARGMADAGRYTVSGQAVGGLFNYGSANNYGGYQGHYSGWQGRFGR